MILPFSAEFERSYSDTYSNDYAKGTVYYSSKAIIFDVFEPIRQRMKLLQKEMILYYPQKRIAFLIKSKTSFFPPFVKNLGLKTVEKGLKWTNFSLKETFTHNDTTWRYWKNSKSKIEIVLAISEEKLCVVETNIPITKSKFKTYYQNYSKLQDLEIPTHIRTEGMLNGKKFKEEITLRNPKILNSSADSIFNFSIPKGVKIKEVKWP